MNGEAYLSHLLNIL